MSIAVFKKCIREVSNIANILPSTQEEAIQYIEYLKKAHEINPKRKDFQKIMVSLAKIVTSLLKNHTPYESIESKLTSKLNEYVKHNIMTRTDITGKKQEDIPVTEANFHQEKIRRLVTHRNDFRKLLIANGLKLNRKQNKEKDVMFWIRIHDSLVKNGAFNEERYSEIEKKLRFDSTNVAI